MSRILSLCALSLLALSSSFAATDWPQFRGPGSTGFSAEAQIPPTLAVEWEAALPGRGLASPVVIGSRIFITASSGPKQERLHVICLDAADGHKLWERQLQATGRTMSHNKTSVAACTPCSDGQRVFALWSCNDLAAFDLEGNLLWVRGLTSDYPNASNSLGMASSPIVIGQTVVAMIENDSESYSLGLDASTGRNLWKLERPKAANWTSPVPFASKGDARPLVLIQSSKGLIGVDPSTGSRMWEYASGASTMSSSVVADGIIYTPSNGITALSPQTNNSAPTQVWNARQLNPSASSPLVIKDRLFTVNGAGILTGAEIQTGAVAWKLRLTGPFSSSLVGAGTRVVAVNEKGLVQVVSVAGKEGVLETQFALPLKQETKELILSTPALSGNHLFIRTDSALWRLGPAK